MKGIAITGIGQLPAARPADRSIHALARDACMAAITDAGLEPKDIRGVSTYPGILEDGSGLSPVSIADIRLMLGLEVDWYSANAIDSPGQLSALFAAALAISAGLARHVLVFRAVGEASARISSGASGAARQAAGSGIWHRAYHANVANYFALFAQRHFHQFGTTSEQLGQLAVVAREGAVDNPNAIYRNPITLQDYLDGRVISSPLRIFDCDVPIDGATAFVMSAVDAARDGPNSPILLESFGTAAAVRSPTFASIGAEAAAAMMWSRTDLRPKDIDTAQLYDGFSILTLHWLEALGFCGRGEGGAFLEGGDRIRRDGELPMNTGGGQLSAGRFHGFGHVHEACTQLWGRAGKRQVADARTAVVSAGAMSHGCALLVRD